MPTDHPEFVHPSQPGEAERLIAETVASIEAANGHTVVGPWLGEVGFEVLYWIPFLHWLFERHGFVAEHELALREASAAVRFYFRDSFPDTPENREVVHNVVGQLAARRPVVLLNTGVVVDDHLDAEPPESELILRPLAGIEAARNLAAQSAIVARAKLFVGTSGGLAHPA